jgi:hypothetical protein
LGRLPAALLTEAPAIATPGRPAPQNDHFTPKFLCYREAGGSECKPFDAGAVAAFRDKLTGCLGTLVQQGFKSIMITPHLDNAIDSNQWCAAWADGARECGQGGRAGIKPGEGMCEPLARG